MFKFSPPPLRVALTFLAALAVAHLLAAEHAAGNTPPQKPNVILIMADDLGYGDISPYDGWIDTPHLDRLAAAGMRFTDFHSNGAVCSPTRAALLTGRYQQRAGISGVVYANPNRQEHAHGLQPIENTFAEALRDAGYATGIFGKWHLGYHPPYKPTRHGFERFVGYVSGNVDFFSHVDQAGAFDWWHDEKLTKEEGYVTHLINKHAVKFIEANRDRPFCLYVPHEAPHYPYQGPNDKPFRVAGQVRVHADESRERNKLAYRQMVEEMDKGVGRIIAALDKHGLREKTLVIFCSDNGATPLGSNGELRGHKGQIWEGGHRVPMIAAWQGRIERGSVNHSLCMSMDLMPTILALAGLAPSQVRPLDGVDLSSVLLEGETITDRKVYWQHRNQFAMRDGPWKLVMGGKTAELFNLADDPGESNSLTTLHRQRTEDMMRELDVWSKRLAKNATPQPDQPPLP